MGTADLQKSKSLLLPVTQVSDLLRTRPVQLQVKEHGRELILTMIRVSVEKCADSLGIKISDSQVVTLCNDLIDVYTHDSVEDIQQCLKKGRQGLYGFGHNKRDSLTMPLIREWMAQHLEEKAAERERIISDRKYNEAMPVTDEKAREYLAKIKATIKQKIKEQSKVKVFENSESAWKEIIDNDPIVRKFFEERV